jgi:hypothetical protein
MRERERGGGESLFKLDCSFYSILKKEVNRGKLREQLAKRKWYFYI